MACWRVRRCFRQVRKSTERLLKDTPRFAVRRARNSLARPAAVGEALATPPHRRHDAPGVDLYRHGRRERLKGSTIWACRACRRSWRRVLYATRAQSVLEGVLALRKEPCLIQELGCLEVCQPIMQRRLGQLGKWPETAARVLAANHGSRLQEALCLGREPIDARRQHACTVAGICRPSRGFASDRHPALDQHPASPGYAHSSRKKGFPLVRRSGAALSGSRLGSFPGGRATTRRRSVRQGRAQLV